QKDLKLSNRQKDRLREKWTVHVRETMSLFEKLQSATPGERERRLQEHRRKSHEKLAAALAGFLDAGQRERLGQLQLQREGPFALLGDHEAFASLKISEEQRKRFREVVRRMQEKMRPLMKKLEEGAAPEEVHPRMLAIRREYATKLEAILTEEQKKGWKKL